MPKWNLLNSAGTSSAIRQRKDRGQRLSGGSCSMTWLGAIEPSELKPELKLYRPEG
jgi:hypothetical protein